MRGEIVLDSLYGEYDRKFREIEAHSFPRGPLENGEGKVQHGQSARHIYASERGRESDLLGVARPTFETSHRWIESHFPPASSPSPSVSDSSPRRRETRLSPTSHEPPLSIVENGKWIDLIRRSGEKSRGEEIRIRSEASTWIWKEMSCDQNWRDERKIIKVIFLLRLRDFYSIFFSNWETSGVSYRE